MNEQRSVDLGLGLSSADVEQIISLAKRGIYVSRSVMYGCEYVSVSWSFTLNDDDDDPSGTDGYMEHLLKVGAQ